mgnify:CR=1 FL=1
MVNFAPWRKPQTPNEASTPTSTEEKDAPRRKWNLGILADPQTDEVPGKQSLLAGVVVRMLTYHSY